MKKVSKEITRLQGLLKERPVQFRQLENLREEDFWIEIKSRSKTWKILIQDEYEDFNPHLPLPALYLVFDALEEYQDAEDFLTWCRSLGYDTSNTKLLDYYRGLGNNLNEIQSFFGTIDSGIYPLEYQLRTGVIDELLDPENNRKVLTLKS